MKRRTDSILTKNRVYLCAPINALVEGIYEQTIPMSEIKKYGDFGLGTFNDLDGEMMLLDGQVYQAASDGSVNLVDDAVQTPFACVTFFHAMSYEESDNELSYEALQQWLTNLMPSPNLFYAFRIEGLFSLVKTRSVPKQLVYRPLVEVTKDQPVFEFPEVEGTCIGFYTPSFMSSVSVPGFHLHFLSTDRQKGGHVLQCSPRKVKTEIQFLYTLELSLPMSLEYLTWDFQRDIEKDLDTAEKDKKDRKKNKPAK